jgi:hypothetical protein
MKKTIIGLIFLFSIILSQNLLANNFKKCSNNTNPKKLYNCSLSIEDNKGNKTEIIFNDKKGKGTITIATDNGIKIISNLQNGEEVSQAIFYPNGDNFIQDFQKNKSRNYGTYIFKNGDKYIGEFLSSVFSGQGTYYFYQSLNVSGSFFNGKFVNDITPQTAFSRHLTRDEQRIENAKAMIQETYKITIGEKNWIDVSKKNLLADEVSKPNQQKTEFLLANMKPEESRAYICEKTYGFKKGSDKFSECVYKIMNAEVDLQKLELQKKLAEAQLETAKANEAAARANAAVSASRSNVPSYDPNVAVAMDRANEIERAKILLNLSQALRTPVSPQGNSPAPQRNCRVNPVNGYINCW